MRRLVVMLMLHALPSTTGLWVRSSTCSLTVGSVFISSIIRTVTAIVLLVFGLFVMSLINAESYLADTFAPELYSRSARPYFYDCELLDLSCSFYHHCLHALHARLFVDLNGFHDPLLVPILFLLLSFRSLASSPFFFAHFGYHPSCRLFALFSYPVFLRCSSNSILKSDH